MVEYGFLRRNESGGFQLGHRFVHTVLENAALPVLTELRDTTGETAQLWIRRGDERICQFSVDSEHELKATLPEGSRLTLPAGSSGRLLAREAEALEELAANGWVESVGRRTPGLGSVSAPVLSRTQMIATICLAMPLSRIKESPGLDFGTALMQAAHRIEADLAQAHER
ncbi:transcriptional regulator, IclR family [Arthrobacter sp. VKM Ac-2550]|nr:transcriptional regulator, IclR family [Arthrobacter sp. VKM Ac-2550]